MENAMAVNDVITAASGEADPSKQRESGESESQEDSCSTASCSTTSSHGEQPSEDLTVSPLTIEEIAAAAGASGESVVQTQAQSPSTSENHNIKSSSSMTTKQPSLFVRMGGMSAMRLVIREFYNRLLADERLNYFFLDSRFKMASLRVHLLQVLRLAFDDGSSNNSDHGSKAEDGSAGGENEKQNNEDSEGLISKDLCDFVLQKHRPLFQKRGLNETHFDLFAGHLQDVCRELKVEEAIIQEAVAVLSPLREIFAQGAREMGGQYKKSIGPSDGSVVSSCSSNSASVMLPPGQRKQKGILKNSGSSVGSSNGSVGRGSSRETLFDLLNTAKRGNMRIIKEIAASLSELSGTDKTLSAAFYEMSPQGRKAFHLEFALMALSPQVPTQLEVLESSEFFLQRSESNRSLTSCRSSTGPDDQSVGSTGANARFPTTLLLTEAAMNRLIFHMVSLLKNQYNMSSAVIDQAMPTIQKQLEPLLQKDSTAASAVAAAQRKKRQEEDEKKRASKKPTTSLANALSLSSRGNSKIGSGSSRGVPSLFKKTRFHDENSIREEDELHDGSVRSTKSGQRGHKHVEPGQDQWDAYMKPTGFSFRFPWQRKKNKSVSKIPKGYK